MASPFSLLVAAVVAAALLYAALAYFSPQEAGAFEKFSRELDLAEATEGSFHSADILLKGGTAMKADGLDTATRSVRFQCTSEQACLGDAVEVMVRQMVVRSDIRAKVHFRCVRSGGIDSCTAYIGAEPAQLELSGLAVDAQVESGEAFDVSFGVKNTGSLDSVEGEYDVGVFLRSTENGKPLETLKKELKESLGRIAPSDSRKISVRLSVDSPGKYVLRATAKGKESGEAKQEKEFTVIDTVNAACKATEKGAITLEEGKCRTEYLCGGCSFEYECISKWREKGIDTGNVYTGDEKGIVVESEPIGGTCV
ncbi:MAG: hypothetical protein HY544_04865 [Candidatus Diapherotrites archaeon]|uniref:CARDB domain-containing protein n=1 Tax=Candidatus Iainarchaeum sp. TaxID=3101447 RepID=A0A8T3YM70_9ARCH|nr:hypothetical protein [Candidatus Diapherotrites archaeon]